MLTNLHRSHQTQRTTSLLQPKQTSVYPRLYGTNNQQENTTMNLFDLATATDTKNKAIAQVASNANPDWYNQVYNIIRDIATTTDTFTTDDVWQAIEHQQLPTPHEPRALGAIMRHAQRDNLIQPTNSYVPSHRVACHARPIRVWCAA
jgi:hypothetical protein